MSSNDELPSDTSSSCDIESLQLAVEGEGSFNSIVQRYRVGSWKKETWRRKPRTTKGIRFVTLESLFENEETVLNCQTISLPCLLCKEMVKALYALAKYLTWLIKPLVSRCCVANLTRMLQTLSFNQTHVLVASTNISLSCLEGRIYIITLLNPSPVLIFY